jgi:hypothetical protein
VKYGGAILFVAVLLGMAGCLSHGLRTDYVTHGANTLSEMRYRGDACEVVTWRWDYKHNHMGDAIPFKTIVSTVPCQVVER